MGRMLIAFNSRTGNTRRLAEAVAGACGGELVEIREKGGPRSLPLTLLGALIGRRPALEPTGADPADFDVVAVGSPVWAGAPTPAARAFAAGLKGGRARFAAFATMGGAGGDKTAAKLAEAAGATPVATCLVTEKDLKSGAFEAEAKRFAEALTAAAEGRAP